MNPGSSLKSNSGGELNTLLPNLFNPFTLISLITFIFHLSPISNQDLAITSLKALNFTLSSTVLSISLFFILGDCDHEANEPLLDPSLCKPGPSKTCTACCSKALKSGTNVIKA